LDHRGIFEEKVYFMFAAFALGFDVIGSNPAPLEEDFDFQRDLNFKFRHTKTIPAFHVSDERQCHCNA
jgi:hypothetical protein